MRVVGYVRVSTDRQAERGQGLDVQEKALRTWAKANGHTLAGIFRDEGVSGSNGIGTRVGLPEALGEIRDGRAKGLVVYRLDRLARDLVLQEQLLAEVKRMGGQVFSTSAAEDGYLVDDPDDPSRKLIRQILGAVSEYERAMVVMRLRGGRKAKAAKGGYAYGAPGLGFRAEDGQLVEDDHEQATLARIRALRAEGNSLRAIAAQLDAEGFKPKRSDHWHPNTLAKILAR